MSSTENAEAIRARRIADEKKKIHEILNDYQSYNILWDSNHKDYKNKTKRREVLNFLCEKHGVKGYREKDTDDDESDSNNGPSEHEPEVVRPARAKRDPNTASRDDRDEKPKTMKMADKIYNKDKCATFAKQVQNKLQKLNPANQLLAEHRINELLFDLETKQLGAVELMPSSSTEVLPPHLESATKQ